MAAATILISVTSTLAEPIARAAASVAPVATSSPVSMGCFSSSDSLTYQDTYGFQTSGYCQNLCVPLNKPVIAINGTDCWCGETMPPASDMVSDSLCDTPCPGFGQATCKWQIESTVYIYADVQ